ncbi:MAG: response regulator transcription factor [Burkholderiales bacterium]
MRVLLVEDDPLVASGVKQGLERAGFVVDVAGDGRSAQQMLALETPAALIVDLGLPDMDGTELIRWARGKALALPILVLTARDSLEDTVRGLDLGADDYLTKPFRLPEMSARLRALVRRSHARADPTLRLGRLAMNPATRDAAVDGQALDLSPREWTLLEHLMLAAPKVVPKARLLEQVTGWDREATPNVIEVHISRIRQKLADARAGVAVRTVRGLGYRLEGDAADAPA